MINKPSERIRNTAISKQILTSFFILCCLLFCCNKQSQHTSNVNGANQASAAALQVKEVNEVNIDQGVYCGIVDREGILWFGNAKGVYRYDGTSFTHFSEEDGLCNNQITSILEDRNGGLWFGTADGLCHYDKEIFTHVPIPFSDTSSVWLDKVYPVLNPNAVHALAQTRNGDIWIGTGGGGAYRYDGEKFTSFLSEIGRKQTDSLHHNWVPSITEDAEGNIWFASMTHGGVSRFDGNEFTHFMPQDGLSDDMVRTIFKDKSDKLWFGFNGNRNSGLTRYDGQSFVSFYKEDGLCSTNIIGMYEDKKGQLWLASDRGGVCIYDGKTFTAFTINGGQSKPRTHFVIEDSVGNIWFGGKDGLWRFDGEITTDMTKVGEY
jgi:ligand-binding sensor domain-containing protein